MDKSPHDRDDLFPYRFEQLHGGVDRVAAVPTISCFPRKRVFGYFVSRLLIESDGALQRLCVDIAKTALEPVSVVSSNRPCQATVDQAD
jgi:hypothetical protein